MEGPLCTERSALSLSQREIYFEYKLAPSSNRHTIGGFIRISGHGIDMKLISHVYDLFARLFALEPSVIFAVEELRREAPKEMGRWS